MPDQFDEDFYAEDGQSQITPEPDGSSVSEPEEQLHTAIPDASTMDERERRFWEAAKIILVASEDGIPRRPPNRFWVAATRNRALFAAGLVFVFLGSMLVFGNIAVYSSNDICAACHEIDPLSKQWATSTHKNVNCIKCHAEPGLAGIAKVNINMVGNGLKHLAGAYNLPIRGHVDDASCLSCHEKDLRPEVIAASSLKVAHRAHTQQECADCHGRLVHTRTDTQVAGTSVLADVPIAKSHQEKDCAVCHQIDSCPHGSAKVACSSCHSANIPRHNVAQQQGIFPMESCLECHKKQRVSSPEDCKTCHVSPHGIDQNCSQCHASQRSWRERSMVHPVELVGAHKNLQCAKCHTSGQDFKGLEYTCSSCHEAPHPPKGQNTTTGQAVDCATCHTPVGWKALNVQHDKIWDGYAGVHAALDCASCHKSGSFEKLSTSCDSCHTRPHDDFGQQCSTCHKAPGVKWL